MDIVSADAKKVGEELLKQVDFTITLNSNFMDNRADAGNIILKEVLKFDHIFQIFHPSYVKYILMKFPDSLTVSSF